MQTSLLLPPLLLASFAALQSLQSSCCPQMKHKHAASELQPLLVIMPCSQYTGLNSSGGHKLHITGAGCTRLLLTKIQWQWQYSMLCHSYEQCIAMACAYFSFTVLSAALGHAGDSSDCDAG